MSIDVNFLRKNGYLLLPDFLTADEHLTILNGCSDLAKMTAAREVVKIENFEDKHGSNTYTYLNKIHLVPSLQGFANSGKLMSVANEIFDNSAVAHMNLLQVSAGGKNQGIAWHRDTAFRFGAMQMMNFLFYPLGTDEERRGITVLPGSQRHEEAAISGSFATASGERTLYPGERDLLIVDGACFHYVAHSLSPKDRMSFNVRIRDATADKEITRYAEFTTGEADFLPDRGEHALR